MLALELEPHKHFLKCTLICVQMSNHLLLPLMPIICHGRTLGGSGHQMILTRVYIGLEVYID